MTSPEVKNKIAPINKYKKERGWWLEFKRFKMEPLLELLDVLRGILGSVECDLLSSLRNFLE